MNMTVKIESRDYWFKVVGMLRQHWALLDRVDNGGCKVFFISDTSGVFAHLNFESIEDAESGLRDNDFCRFSEDGEAQKALSPPASPFEEHPHPNGLIYSSGQYWHRNGT